MTGNLYNMSRVHMDCQYIALLVSLRAQLAQKASAFEDGLPNLDARVVWIGFSAPTTSYIHFQFNETYANEVLSVTIPRPPTACRPRFWTRNAVLPILSKMPCILILFSNSIDGSKCVPLKIQLWYWRIWMWRNITSHVDSEDLLKFSWMKLILVS